MNKLAVQIGIILIILLSPQLGKSQDAEFDSLKNLVKNYTKAIEHTSK